MGDECMAGWWCAIEALIHVSCLFIVHRLVLWWCFYFASLFCSSRLLLLCSAFGCTNQSSFCVFTGSFLIRICLGIFCLLPLHIKILENRMLYVFCIAAISLLVNEFC